MINDNYLEGLAKLVVGESVTIPSHMAFGSSNDDLTASDTTLAGEFDRISLETGETNGTIAKIIGVRSSVDADDETVFDIGLFNAASNGNLWSATLISSLLHTTDFDLEVQFWIEHQRG